MEFFRWVGLVVLSALILGLLYIGVPEIYSYVTRSEIKAQAQAQAEFQRICDEQGFDPKSFRGPSRPNPEAVDNQLGQYNFVWTKSPGETIFVGITYLPYDVGSSISQELTERKYKESRP